MLKRFNLSSCKSQVEGLNGIGTELYRIRNAMGWSRELVASITEIHPRTITRVETGVGASFSKVSAISFLYLCQYAIEPEELYKLTRLLATYILVGQTRIVNKYDDSHFKEVIQAFRLSRNSHTLQIIKKKKEIK